MASKKNNRDAAIKRVKKVKSSTEKDQMVAVLENIYDDFRAFGESIDSFREETSRNFADLRREVEGIDKRLVRVEAIVFGLEKRVGKLEYSVDQIKEEISDIRRTIAQGFTDKQYKKLEHRVEVLEEKVGV